MTGPGADSSARKARLDARSATLRAKVDELLGDFDKRTEQLREARQAAAALSAELSSPDGAVRVRIDSSGALTRLQLGPTAFDGTTPEQLARTITELVVRGTAQVRRQATELMRPLTEDLPDVSDLVPGAPSLADMLPGIPEGPAPETPAAPRHAAVDRDEAPETWLRGNR
jgi:DNA-binding protein YbaB